MNTTGESEEKMLLETRTAQLWSLQGSLLQGQVTQGCPLAIEEVPIMPDKCQSPAAGLKAGLDEARFTAGIVQFYEALLKEPVPEKMLRLIEQIAKRERGQ